MEIEYKKGFDSYFNNSKKYQNPYKRGTVEYNLFERGWTQALKKSRSKSNTSHTGEWDDLPKKPLSIKQIVDHQQKHTQDEKVIDNSVFGGIWGQCKN